MAQSQQPPGAVRVLLAFVLAFASTVASAAPFAYVPLPFADQVAVVDLATNTVRKVPVGNSPVGVAIEPGGARVYVANGEDNTVSVIATASNTVVGTIAMNGRGPLGMAVNPAGTRLAVALTGDDVRGNTVEIFDTSTRTRVATATVGIGPIAVAYNPSGTRLYVANATGNTISVLDAATSAVIATIPVREGPAYLTMNASGTRLYVSQAGSAAGNVNLVSVIDLSSNTVLTTIAVGGDPLATALNPSGSRLIVANNDTDSLSILDTATNQVVSTIASPSPASIAFHPDGSRFYVLNFDTGDLGVFDSATLQRLSTIAVGGSPAFAFGHFITPPAASPGANTPGALSGLWWNPAESGWGISFTQRGSIIFAAWYTYDDGGNPTWYVASDCRMANASSCSGTLYQVAGPRFFGVPFNASSVVATPAGTLNVGFQGNSNATMTYSLGGQSRTVSITRQVFQPSGTAPATNYTDLWWNPNESGWGLSVTQQFNLMFLAWYVYDNSGNPVWYVASSCAVTSGGNGCSGTLFRTTGPAFGTAFDPAQVQVVPVGSVTLTFSDGNNGMLSYVVDGVAGSKAITRQVF
ncbi:MAG TPA: YncE family protein [Usitatibacter sp.]|nr:YncE family protein [Usitatibacter sp.]